LDYSQLKTRVLQVDITSFDIKECLVSVIDLLALKNRSNGIVLETEFGEALPREFNSDSSRIKQVIINLVTNAIKCSKRGSKVIVRAFLIENRAVRIEVQDFGLGIKEKDRKILFQEFGKIVDEEHLNLNPKGVGLGLWICQSVCSELGSGISVDGINFYF